MTRAKRELILSFHNAASPWVAFESEHGRRAKSSMALIDVQHGPTTAFNSIADSSYVGETSLDYIRSKFGR
jgi:hypothetical protein